jgi:hypothetical protein
MQDTTVTLITAEASDQTTVTTGFDIYLPSIHKAVAPFTAVPVGVLVVGVLPVAGVIGIGRWRRR